MVWNDQLHLVMQISLPDYDETVLDIHNQFNNKTPRN